MYFSRREARSPHTGGLGGGRTYCNYYAMHGHGLGPGRLTYMHMYMGWMLQVMMCSGLLTIVLKSESAKNENYNDKMLARHEYCTLQVEKEGLSGGLHATLIIAGLEFILFSHL